MLVIDVMTQRLYSAVIRVVSAMTNDVNYERTLN